MIFSNSWTNFFCSQPIGHASVGVVQRANQDECLARWFATPRARELKLSDVFFLSEARYGYPLSCRG